MGGPRTPEFPEPNHAYRVLVPFGEPLLREGETIKVRALTWGHDPTDYPPKEVLFIACTTGTVRLFAERDRVVIRELRQYLQDLGTFNEEAARAERKQHLVETNARADEDQKLLQELIKEDLQHELERARAQHPGRSDRELVHEILQRKHRDGVY